jgi:hypothetical protein
MIKFIVSYYSKPFSADVGSIQIFCRIRLTKNLSKPLLHGTTVIQMQCKTKYFYQFHLTTQKKKTKCIQNIYRYIVKNIKKRRFFFYIVREENIRPQVLRDKISPPFFQHYGKKISYRIHRYYLQLKHWLSVFKYFVGSDWRKIFQNLCYTEPLSYKCNVKLNRWWIFFCHFVMINIWILPTSAENGLE